MTCDQMDMLMRQHTPSDATDLMIEQVSLHLRQCPRCYALMRLAHLQTLLEDPGYFASKQHQRDRVRVQRVLHKKQAESN